ncbi:E3 ubiquitin-protein ligase RFWD3-like isoform X3 [Ananas comosus]|uniref:RING-type E3 ubiquitin transferase n=1 Tax=Ananas comosus TaxID=4615 RepID=A0A6P5FE73_ANACO|nr:E3 ubiquitin-protein ligase RFWD3-like isoform X3 [Ananas comosus]
MASNNPPGESGREPHGQEEADEDESDEEYDPNRESEEEYDPYADYEEYQALVAAYAAGRNMGLPFSDPAMVVPEEGDGGDGWEVEVVPFMANVEDMDEGGDAAEREEDEEEEEDEEGEEEGRDDCESHGGGGSENAGSGTPHGAGLDKPSVPNCPVCLEMWTSEGLHRVCCIPCGHVYGRSCLERWLHQCGKKIGKCPQCNRKFRQKEIINLYAPLIVVPNDDLEKELQSLREKHESLMIEREQLLEEISKHKKRPIVRESSKDRQKLACLEHSSSGPILRAHVGHVDRRLKSAAGTFSGSANMSSDCSDGSYSLCNFVLQIELTIDGARVMGIDAPSRIALVSGKAPGLGGEHVLSKISLLVPQEIEKIQLPPNTKAIRDLHILPNRLALLASLGRKLSLFSMTSNNFVLQYNLPAPAWSCSGDCSSSYHIYTGLQNGMLLVFDVRQTAVPMHSMDGLSMHPIHTIHSIVHENGMKKVLTASSVGTCLWDINSNGERPILIPEMESQGVCISLACGSPSSDDIVASFRPKVDLTNDANAISSQISVSPSSMLSNSGKLGSHVLIKRVNGTSFHKDQVGYGNVSGLRMCKSAIISSRSSHSLFAYGDELLHGVRIWSLPSFQEYTVLKPHRSPILDLRYATCPTGPRFLGCVSEEKLQVLFLTAV